MNFVSKVGQFPTVKHQIINSCYSKIDIYTIHEKIISKEDAQMLKLWFLYVLSYTDGKLETDDTSVYIVLLRKKNIIQHAQKIYNKTFTKYTFSF